MPYSLDQIKSFNSIDIDNFAIRGARIGVNNAGTTGPLYDDGTFFPFKTKIYGDTSVSSGDTTVILMSFDPPYGNLTALDLVPGDTLIVRSDSTLSIKNIINSTSVAVKTAPAFSGLTDSTYSLIGRDYLIEPDVANNSITTGLARFTNGSKKIYGLGTQWLTDLTSGDSIQLNSYQKYFIIETVDNDHTCNITENFDAQALNNPDPTDYHPYTAKKWRLGRLKYQYVKQNFTYDNNHAKWVYDSTTGNDKTAQATFDSFLDGINLKFTPSLNPATSPDLMDSNSVLTKTFTKNTTNDLFQYPLPAVPRPEESIEFFINDNRLDRFPDGNKDYVVSYSQLPVYQYPPPMDKRTVANVMFLKGVQDVKLDPVNTSYGVINFTDSSGNSLSGIMPGSETIVFDDTTQIAHSDYVINVDAGQAYASDFKTGEPLVKYVMYQSKGLYDYGLNIFKDGTRQNLTIPGQPTDDILFDYESGLLKPINTNTIGPNEEYVVQYHTEGAYISNESHIINSPTDWIRVNSYPIKFLSAFISRDGTYLDEGVDYRVSYLTGRVVFFNPLVKGAVIVANYSPLEPHLNGLSYNSHQSYCTTYDGSSSVASINPLAFTFPNPSLIALVPIDVVFIYNASKAKFYNVVGAKLNGDNVQLVSDSTNIAVATGASDTITMAYKFASEGLEHSPVETINFTVGTGTNYMALVGMDATNLFPTGEFVQLTNVDTAGDFYFQDASSVFDGEDTVVYFTGSAPSDIINPLIYLSDTNNFTFNNVPIPLSIASGTTNIKFPGTNISRTFRPGQLMNLGTDYYSIASSQYDSSAKVNTVILGVPTVTDYTNSSILSNVTISDVPLYFQGDSVVSTANEIITDPLAPVMTMNYDGYATVTKTVDILQVTTDTSTYNYPDSQYPWIVNLVGILNTISGFHASPNAIGWQTDKLQLVTDLVVTRDSTTVLNANPALFYNAVDTTDYSIQGGLIALNYPLYPGDRYNMDYLGLSPLEDTTVTFSGSYFSTLPAKSKVSASMQYANVDQFYIEAISQRNYIDTVIIPSRKSAAQQQSGNVGQGGDLPGDENSGNSSGGLTSVEYDRVDAAIESTIFKNVFDFFNGRLQAYADEVLAMRGWALCNNDGLFSDDDASGGVLPINRLVPWADYTNMEPFKIGCLTGQAIPYSQPGPKRPNDKKPKRRRRRFFGFNTPATILPAACRATFIPSVTDVTCTTGVRGFPSYWTHQLRVGDYIKPLDSTKNYQITTIVNDSSMVITPPYAGTSPLTAQFIMTSKYPLYDDDGYTGPKAISSVSQDFGLENGDVFDIIVDGSNQSYTFLDPLVPSIFSSMFPISNYSASDVAKILSSNLGVTITPQWIYDPDTAYGYDNGLVLRADGTCNKVILQHGAAVIKLGFEPDSTYTGNNNNIDNDPEFIYDNAEMADLYIEGGALTSALATPNKLGRASYAITVRNECLDETAQIFSEMLHLNAEIASTATIMLEPSMAGYANAVLADSTHKLFMADSTPALVYDQSIVTNFQSFLTAQKWSADFLSQDTTHIHGKRYGVGVPYYSGIGVTSIIGQTSFSIRTDSSYDRRILNTGLVDGVAYLPTVRYEDNNAIVEGSWTDEGGPAGTYTVGSDATFTFNPRPMFVLKPINETFSIEITPSTYLTLYWSAGTNYYYFSNYPTIGDLKAALLNVPGLTVSGSSVHDTSSCNSLVYMASTVLSPSVNLLTSGAVILMTVTNDNSYNFSYSVDSNGLGITWDSSSLYFPYSTYGISGGIGNLKTDIITNIPGMDATGDSLNDSSNPSGFILIGSTVIPPDATLYSGLRENYVNYWTIDDKNLLDRSNFDSSRITTLTNRLTFLSFRENQIISDVTNEEYFRTAQGCTGNLYNWADNQYNKVSGSFSKKSQAGKQQNVNKSSLEVNLRITSGSSGSSSVGSTSPSSQICSG